MKNISKWMLVLLLAVVGGHSVQAARITAIVQEYTLKYQSVDANNKPITLSEKIYVNKLYTDIKFIMLNNHPTTTSDALVPTGSNPQVPEVKYMCDGTERCMVVCPDYLGYGASKSTTHPYMCPDLTARNVVDGLVAAIDYIKTQKQGFRKYSFNSNYYTLNVGYSQGGAVALAVHKYLETTASQTVKDKVKLKKSICGAGPYKQTYMFDQMEQDDDMFYPLYIPYTIDGMKYAYNNILSNLSEQEIYTEEFLNSGLLTTLRAKNTVAADLNQMFADQFGGQIGFYDMIRPEYQNRSSKLYTKLRQALTQCDLLEGWTPTKPIIFFHWRNDEVVPYEETQMAYDHFSSLGCPVYLQEADGISITNEFALKSYDKSHMGYGTKFYLLLFSGDLRNVDTQTRRSVEETTGIESVETAKDDAVYDLQGRRVQPTHGMYIKNGVKFMKR